MQLPETLVEGKYEVLEKIREGGMGTIYKVRHRLLDEIRVIKVMRPSVAGEEEYRRRFLDEARTAIRLKHPNICAIHDFALGPDGSSYLVMELIDGVTLADLLKAQGALSVPLSLEITHQTLLALGYLHRKQVIHRDIAPDNIMLTRDDEGKSVVKLIDLGIAKDLDRDGDLTSTGVFLGKLRYASPEQYGALGPGMKIDGRSDLYSLGLVLSELLSGKRSVAAPKPGDARPPAPQALTALTKDGTGVAVPADVRELITRALQKNRDDRFASAAEFDQAVMAALERLGRKEFDEDGPTMVIGISLQPPGAELTVTPGAQNRLDLQFAPLATPTPLPPTPLPPATRVDTVADARLRQQRELDQVREREEKRDLQALHSMVAAGNSSAAAVREAREAIERVRRLAEWEKQQKEDAAWRRGCDEKTPQAWARFQAEHPDSPRCEEAARRHAEAQDFEHAASQESHTAWAAFLAKWPSAAHHEAARACDEQLRKKAEEALHRARAVGTADAFRAFLASHGGSHLAPAAERLLAEHAAFDKARSEGTEHAWRAFLEQWPFGSRAADAAEGLKHAREQEELLRERAEFDRAIREGKAGCERFLREHPGSRHTKAIRETLRELEEEAVLLRIGQLGAALQLQELESLAKEHPPTTRVGSAAAAALERVRAELARRQQLKEDADWAVASAAGHPDPWKKFLADHPASSHASTARARLTALAALEEEKALLEQVRGYEANLDEGELEKLQAVHSTKTTVGRAVAAALVRIGEMREKLRMEEEEADWASAAQGREDAWRRFLEEHPDSRHAAEARHRLAEMAEMAELAEAAAKPAAGIEAPPEVNPALTMRIDLADPKVALALAAPPEPARPPARVEPEIQAELAVEPEIHARIAAEPHITVQAPKSPGLLILAIAVVAGIALWLWLSHGRAPGPAPAPAAAVAPAAASDASAAPASNPAAAGSGDLAIDVQPWGRVDRIEDSEGKVIEAGLPQYTPLFVRVPAGRYSVVVSNPGYADGMKLSVEVRAGERALAVGHFETMDPAAYFRSQGWGQ